MVKNTHMKTAMNILQDTIMYLLLITLLALPILAATPTQNNPIISPQYIYTDQNLTCTPYNTTDTDGDTIQNITTWSTNNIPNTLIYLPFEGGTTPTNVKDYSGYNRLLVVADIKNQTQCSNNGGCANITAPQGYIKINTGFQLDIYTVTAWINTKYTTYGMRLYEQNNYRITYVTFNNATHGNFTFQQDFSAGTSRWQTQMGTLTPDTWIHIAIVYNGSNISNNPIIYLNGIQQTITKTTNAAGTPRTETSQIYIGNTPGLTRGINGTIDNFRIYNRTLTSDEIYNDYANNNQQYITKNTKKGDIYNCTITVNDGTSDGQTKSSITVYPIGNPNIQPTNPTANQNLYCQANATYYTSESIRNITTWIKNGKPYASLYLPMPVGTTNNTYIKDYSGNNNQITIRGTKGYNSTNHWGWWEFNSTTQDMDVDTDGSKINGSIIINNSASLNEPTQTKKITMSFWIKMQKIPGITWQFIFQKSTATTNRSYGLHFYTPTMTMWYENSNGTAQDDIYIGQPHIDNNGWQHLTITFDACRGLAKSYVNGIWNYTGQTVRALCTGLIENQANLSIGAINGSITDFRIYPTILTDEQILINYQESNKTNAYSQIDNRELKTSDTWQCNVTYNNETTEFTETSQQITENIRQANITINTTAFLGILNANFYATNTHNSYLDNNAIIYNPPTTALNSNQTFHRQKWLESGMKYQRVDQSLHTRIDGLENGDFEFWSNINQKQVNQTSKSINAAFWNVESSNGNAIYCNSSASTDAISGKYSLSYKCNESTDASLYPYNPVTLTINHTYQLSMYVKYITKGTHADRIGLLQPIGLYTRECTIPFTASGTWNYTTCTFKAINTTYWLTLDLGTGTYIKIDNIKLIDTTINSPILSINIDDHQNLTDWAIQNNQRILSIASAMPAYLANLSTECSYPSSGTTYYYTCQPINYTLFTEAEDLYINTITRNGTYDNSFDIEVWNEPDLSSWIKNATSQTEKWIKYIQLYNNTYNKIKTTHPNISIGGPGASSIARQGTSSLWLINFISNFSQKMDFYSWHYLYTLDLRERMISNYQMINDTCTTYNATCSRLIESEFNTDYIGSWLPYYTPTETERKKEWAKLYIWSINNLPATLSLVSYQWTTNRLETDPAYEDTPNLFAMISEPQLNNKQYVTYNTTKEFANNHKPTSKIYNTNTTTKDLYTLLSKIGRNWKFTNTWDFNDTVNITLTITDNTIPAITYYNDTNYYPTITQNPTTLKFNYITGPYETQTYNFTDTTNIAPTTPTEYLANQTTNINDETKINLTCSGSTDEDNDPINYEIYALNTLENNTWELQQNNSNTSFEYNLNPVANFQEYQYKCRANDGLGGESNYTPTITIYYYNIATIDPQWGNTTITYTSLNTGNNITVSCNHTLEVEVPYIKYYLKYNTNDTNLNYQTNNQIKLQTTDFLDQQDIYCWLCFGSVCTQSQTYTIPQNTINTILTFNAQGYQNTSEIDTTWEFTNAAYTETNNPLQIQATKWLNQQTHTATETITITDTQGYYSPTTTTTNITETQTNYTFILNQKYLTLSFWQNAVATATNGYISDINKSRNWTNATVILVQSELAKGPIHVRFSATSGENWTQYYEYINDQKQDITDTLEILENSDWSAYIQVLDYNSNPILNAKIRAEFSWPSQNNSEWVYHKLFAQRLTDDQGYTFIFADKRTEVLLTITKDGYEPYQALITIGDESFTKTSPFKVYLKQTSTGLQNDVWINLPTTITNKSQDITGTIMAINKNKIEITTTYRTAQMLGKYDITNTQDTNYMYHYTLKSGTDYTPTTDENITVQVYVNDQLYKTIQIEYKTTGTNQFNNLADLIPAQYLNPILYIALILISLTISLLIKTEGTATTIFTVGSILLMLISLQFAWLTTFILLKYVLRGIHKIISE